MDKRLGLDEMTTRQFAFELLAGFLIGFSAVGIVAVPAFLAF